MAQAPPGIVIDSVRKSDATRIFYSARQLNLSRSVLLVGLAPGVLPSSPVSRQLEAEGRVLARLDHPNILRLHDLVYNEGRIFLVLENVEGPTLPELAAQKLNWQALAAIGLDLCRALHHAHRLGHYHGSLTSESVQFSKDGRTKLSGFGRNVMHASDKLEVLDTEVRGGLSPETSIGQALTPLSDIFALGALLHELASGHAPFGEISAFDYPTRVRNEAHTPLIKVAPSLPPALTGIIEQMLEKMPARRPASVGVIAEQLEALIGGATLSIIGQELVRLGHSTAHDLPPAPRPAPLEPAQRFVWSSKWLAAGIVAAIALLTLAIVIQSRNTQERAPVKYEINPIVDQDTALHLRVIASPWAHVFVDGIHRETTPFAHPLSLSAGSHVVRLEHPNAPPEERTISGKAGQVVLLNVQMHVKVELPSSLPVGKVEESTP